MVRSILHVSAMLCSHCCPMPTFLQYWQIRRKDHSFYCRTVGFVTSITPSSIPLLSALEYMAHYFLHWHVILALAHGLNRFGLLDLFMKFTHLQYFILLFPSSSLLFLITIYHYQLLSLLNSDVWTI